jgi:hypothetical protein
VSPFERWPELTRADEARHGAPSDCRQALVKAAEALRERVLGSPPVISLSSFALATFPYPTRYGLRDAFARPYPYLGLCNRVFVVRFLDFQGNPRVLLVSPSDVERNAETPFFKGLVDDLGPLKNLATPLIAQRGLTVANALEMAGVKASEVDFITYDHLHTQDLRGWLGPNAFFPRAKLLVMKDEWQSVHGLTPPQRPWYCPSGVDGIAHDRVIVLEHSVALGHGVLLVHTPGHTGGNHSIVLHSHLGLTVTSENGICPDSYAPHASAIPGLAAYARKGMDVVLNGNTLERGLDQYLSMVFEKTLAGPSPRDSRFPNFLPSSELTPTWYAPGLSPGLAFGDIVAPS